MQKLRSYSVSSFLTWLPRAAIFGLVLSACSASDAAPRIASGVYEGMMLATDEKGTLTGYFRQSMDNATCSFFIKGLDRDALPIKITTWESTVLPGTLQPKAPNSVEMKVEQGGDYPGCSNVLGTSIDEGMAFTRTLETKWVGVKVVQSDRAFFHSEPSKEKRGKAYVVKGNVLAVLAVKGDWLEAQFYNHDNPSKIIKGWVLSSDVMDPAPPK